MFQADMNPDSDDEEEVVSEEDLIKVRQRNFQILNLH